MSIAIFLSFNLFSIISTISMNKYPLFNINDTLILLLSASILDIIMIMRLYLHLMKEEHFFSLWPDPDNQ